MKIQFDTLDNEILAALEQDARTSYRKLARGLGVSQSTVRARVNRLLDQKAIRFKAITNPVELGLNWSALIRMIVAPGSARAVVKALSGNAELTFVCHTAGRHNVVAFVVAPDELTLTRFVADRIKILEGMIAVEIHDQMQVYKHSFREAVLGFKMPDPS